MGIRTVGYVRISLDATGEGRGVARQQDDCEQLISRRSGWELVADVFVENDLSASGRKRRPKFEAMLAMVEAGEVDAVVAWSWDRLTRNRRDEVRFIEACQRGAVTVALVRGSDIDMGTPSGRMVADMLASQARFEIDQKGDRQMRANKQRADEGKPSQGGRRAFGFEADKVTVRNSEAVHVKAAYTALLAGQSLNAIARDLNEAGLTTVLGKPFNHVSVRQMLSNPRYAGIRVHRLVEVGRAAWDAIVDEPTFRAAVSVLNDPSRRTNHVGGEKRRLLTGVGLCGVCNDGSTTVLGGSRAAGRPLYQCSRAKHLQRALEPIDYIVERIALEWVSRPEAAELLVDKQAPDLAALNAERITLVARQGEAAISFADGDITAAQLRTITERLTTRIGEIDQRMSHRNRERVLGDLVRASDPKPVWDGMSLERRQAVLRELGGWVIGKGRAGGDSRPGAVRYSTVDSYNVAFTPAE
jgi:site-specific DNA recombinase